MLPFSRLFKHLLRVFLYEVYFKHEKAFKNKMQN